MQLGGQVADGVDKKGVLGVEEGAEEARLLLQTKSKTLFGRLRFPCTQAPFVPVRELRRRVEKLTRKEPLV